MCAMIEKLRMFCIGNVKGHLGAVPFQRGRRRFVPQGLPPLRAA
jgi:hypothetical protein